MNQTIVNDAIEFVRNTFKDDHSGHDHFQPKLLEEAKKRGYC